LKKIEQTVKQMDYDKRTIKIEDSKKKMDGIVKKNFNMETERETVVMAYYYRFIMIIHYQHFLYQQKLKSTPNTTKNT
jgi:hypothetical protein